MFRYSVLIPALVCSLLSARADAARPLDERDQLKEAHVYHIMFRTRAEAINASEILRNVPASGQLISLQDMARKKSIDPGSMSAGGDLGIIRPGQMEIGFEELVFGLPVREVSAPVRSSYGWHVLYIDSRTVKPVAQICEAGLKSYARSADSKLTQALALSKSYKPDDEGSVALSRVLGVGWGKPVRDVAGNMRYFKGTPLEQPGVFDVSEHIEYSYATYHSAKNACMRSSVSRFTVNCKAGTVADNGMIQYELRGAQGRELANITAQPGSPVLPYMYNDIYATMHELVCRISNPANVASNEAIGHLLQSRPPQ